MAPVARKARTRWLLSSLRGGLPGTGEHEGEEEENGDSAAVDEDLDDGEELGEEEDEEAGDSEKREDEEEGGVDYVAGCNGADGADHGHCGEDKEKDEYGSHYSSSASGSTWESG